MVNLGEILLEIYEGGVLLIENDSQGELVEYKYLDVLSIMYLYNNNNDNNFWLLYSAISSRSQRFHITDIVHITQCNLVAAANQCQLPTFKHTGRHTDWEAHDSLMICLPNFQMNHGDSGFSFNL